MNQAGKIQVSDVTPQPSRRDAPIEARETSNRPPQWSPWRRHETEHRVLGRSFSLYSPYKSINANYLINEAFYQIFFCVKIISRSKSTFVPTGIPIGFQMAEKNANTQTHTYTHTHTHFCIYISRDLPYSRYYLNTIPPKSVGPIKIIWYHA